MDTLFALFSHVCGQHRAFVVDGLVLPVCQRCLGLYVGAAVTFAWLLAARLHRSGLPPGRVLLLQAVLLSAALLGGLHVIDVGPRWRLACGLWTGYVAVAWLLAGSAHLGGRARPSRGGAGDWPALALPAGLTLLALAWDQVAPLGWWFWSAAALAGMLALVVAVLLTLANVASAGEATSPETDPGHIRGAS